MAQWCNPFTLQSGQSCGVGSIPSRAPPLERHDKESQTRLGQLCFCNHRLVLSVPANSETMRSNRVKLKGLFIQLLNIYQ